MFTTSRVLKLLLTGVSILSLSLSLLLHVPGSLNAPLRCCCARPSSLRLDNNMPVVVVDNNDVELAEVSRKKGLGGGGGGGGQKG